MKNKITPLHHKGSHRLSQKCSRGLFSVLVFLRYVYLCRRLSLVWDFRDHGHLYATHIAKDMMSTFSLRDKIFLFVHKNKHQKNRATAIGVIWNRSVRELAKVSFHWLYNAHKDIKLFHELRLCWLKPLSLCQSPKSKNIGI